MQNEAGENVDLYIPRKWCVVICFAEWFKSVLRQAHALFCNQILARGLLG